MFKIKILKKISIYLILFVSYLIFLIRYRTLVLGLRLAASWTEFCTPVEVIRGQVRVPVKLARVALASLINQVPVISWLASQNPF